MKRLLLPLAFWGPVSASPVAHANVAPEALVVVHAQTASGALPPITSGDEFCGVTRVTGEHFFDLYFYPYAQEQKGVQMLLHSPHLELDLIEGYELLPGKYPATIECHSGCTGCVSVDVVVTADALYPVQSTTWGSVKGQTTGGFAPDPHLV